MISLNKNKTHNDIMAEVHKGILKRIKQTHAIIYLDK